MGEGFEISPLPAGGSSAGLSRPYHCGNREVISASVVSPMALFRGKYDKHTMEVRLYEDFYFALAAVHARIGDDPGLTAPSRPG